MFILLDSSNCIDFWNKVKNLLQRLVQGHCISNLKKHICPRLSIMQRLNWKFQILLLIVLEEIWRSPVEVDRLYHSLQGFIHPRWAGVLPSTVSVGFSAEPSSTEQYSHQKSDSAVACSGIFHQFATSRVLLTSWTGWSTQLRFDSGKNRWPLVQVD